MRGRWELGVRWSAPLEVTTRWDRRRKGIRVHRGRLDRRDVTRQFGIPVTTPARTLLDVAEQLDRPTLTRAVNEARLAHRATLTDLAELVARSPGRATRRLRPFVERGGGPTRSRFEDAFLEFAAGHGLPTPEVNQIVAGYEVDVFWRRSASSWSWMGRRRTRTPSKQTATATPRSDAGFPVLRITWDRLNGAPQREADRLHSLLDQRSTAAGPAA